jgi:hypothetical protein
MDRGHSKYKRKQSGMALATLLTLVAVLIVLPISLFSYDMVKYNLAQLQLKHCVDSAALAAGCGVTGSNTGSLTTTEQAAMAQALYMFQQNGILGNALSTATSSYAASSGTQNPNIMVTGNKSALYFQFINPYTMTQVGLGGANGKIIRVTGFYGFVPDFAKIMGLNNGVYQVVQQSDGGLPQLDVVLCFDISASMDDYTKVCLVNRYAKSTSNTSNSASGYSANGYNGYTFVAQDYLYAAVKSTSVNGTATNAVWPMNMDLCDQCSINANGSGHGAQTATKPPYSQGNSNLTSNTFTDIVVPLDYSTSCSQAVTISGTYKGTSYTYAFPAGAQGIAVLVEAARGNLESTANATAAGLYVDSSGRALGQLGGATGVKCQPGWFAAYYTALFTVMEPSGGVQTLSLPSNAAFTLTSISSQSALPLRHPIGDGIAAAESFFQVLFTDADVHFGLVAFNDTVGTSANSNYGTWLSLYGNYTPPPAATPYPCDGEEPPVPYLPLNPNTPGAAGSNYDTNNPPAAYGSVNACLYNSSSTIPTASGSGYTAQTLPPYSVCAIGGTYIATAINKALAMLLPTGQSAADGTAGLNLARPGSTKAIVLFTDGLPTGPGSDSGSSDPNAQAAATAAGSNGIPVYTIGLSLIPGLQSTQATVLTDASGSTGIAALSGNGATFTQTTNSGQLTAVFQHVARQLVQLVN